MHLLLAAVGREAPAVTYAFLHRSGAASMFAAGRADAASDAPIDTSEPLPLYSMTKAITAIATLELLARRAVDLETDIRDLVPSFPFREHRVRVVDLLAHTSGLPNPFPLRWVHRPEEHSSFDDGSVRERISRTVKAATPNVRYRYSNIGYWWLGALIERLSGKCYVDALAELGLPSTTVYPPSARVLGHVRRFGILRTVATIALDSWVLAGAAGRWMRIARHHVDGIAYGGLLGNPEGLLPFLSRLNSIAHGESGETLRRALIQPRYLASGRGIPMTAALHVGDGFLFKEGGGAGFHSELRVHVERRCASVIVANSSEIDVKRLLSKVDAVLLR